MEEPFNKQDRLVEQLLKELPLEKPSRDFTKNVMRHIEHKVTRTAYRPLIPKHLWWFIGLVFAAGLYWLYLNPATSLVDMKSYGLMDASNWKNPLENLQLPITAIYAISFMALFLIQIPFLKRLIDKSYA